MSRLANALKAIGTRNALLLQVDSKPVPQRNALLDAPRYRSMSEDELYRDWNPIDELRGAVNVGNIPQGNPQERETLANALLSITPGPGNVMSANDALSSAGDAYNAFRAGDYKGGALASALTALSGAGAVAGLPFGKFAKGAADAGKRTLFSGAGSSGSKVMTDEFDEARVILPHSHFDPTHLAKVKEEMQRRGSPEIRGIPIDDTFAAVEGSHRLRAAQELGVPVQLKSILDDDVVDLNAIGIDDMNWFDDRVVPRQEFVDWYLQNWLPRDVQLLSVKVPR